MALAHYCRTGELWPHLEVRSERVHHYHRLVFQIVTDALQSAFPISHQWLAQKHQWDALVKRFWSQQQVPHHEVWKLPHALLIHVAKHEEELCAQWPFLNDLLQFEWDDLELFMRRSNHQEAVFALRRFAWPVHQVPPIELGKEQPGQWFVLGIRHPHNHLVYFFELQPLHALILEWSVQGPLSDELWEDWESQHGIAIQESQRAAIELRALLKDFDWQWF
jgi:hypothetical protein